MAERLQQIPKKLLDIWNKFTNKQKTMIISVFCVIVIAFALLIFLINRVEYQKLKVCETESEANEVKNILDDEGIAYKYNENSLTFRVDEKSYQKAYFALLDNDIPSTGITLEQLLNNDITSTKYDKTLRLNLYLQNNLSDLIRDIKGVDNAEIIYLPEESNKSILTEVKDTNASVFLIVNDDFEYDSAETIAEMVATAIGNDNAEKIKVSDQNGNLLFGGEQDLYTGSANSNEDFKERLTNTYINNIYKGLIKRGYDDVEIMPHLELDMDRVEELQKTYTPAEGQEQGLYQKSYTYTSENAGYSGGGEPGTTPNDETSYLMPDNNSQTGSVEIEEFDYLPNVTETNTKYEVGAVISEESSIAIVLRRVNIVKEEVLEKQGALEDISFEEYAQAPENNKLQEEEVEPSVKTLVSKATGIAEEDIEIQAFVQSVFVPKVERVREWTDYLQIALAVLIVGLLVFVVFKGVGPVEVTELEPELSVEQLLATTKENQIEDIEFNEVSEVRRMIEKFVDEKPEAVAQLLRNWLNEDWS